MHSCSCYSPDRTALVPFLCQPNEVETHQASIQISPQYDSNQASLSYIHYPKTCTLRSSQIGLIIVF